MRFRATSIVGDFARAVEKNFKDPIEKRATGALDKVGVDIKTWGRGEIARAGFGKKWQNALRVNRYPRQGASLSAALWIYHAIPYAIVFETGATIRGNPYLWIPLDSTPKKLGRYSMTPKRYVAEIGPLTFVHPPGKSPLLVAKFAGKRRGGKLSAGGLKRGASSGGESVPVFVGIKTASLRKRFGLYKVFDRARARLGFYYINS